MVAAYNTCEKHGVVGLLCDGGCIVTDRWEAEAVRLRAALADIRAIMLGWIQSGSSAEVLRRIETALAQGGDDDARD